MNKNLHSKDIHIVQKYVIKHLSEFDQLKFTHISKHFYIVHMEKQRMLTNLSQTY